MVPESPLGLTLVRSRGGELSGNPIYLACFFPDSNQGVINWKSLPEELGVGGWGSRVARGPALCIKRETHVSGSGKLTQAFPGSGVGGLTVSAPK